MSNYEKIEELLTKIRDNNNRLINQVRTMNSDDQRYYSKKVADIIKKAQESTALINNHKNLKL